MIYETNINFILISKHFILFILKNILVWEDWENRETYKNPNKKNTSHSLHSFGGVAKQGTEIPRSHRGIPEVRNTLPQRMCTDIQRFQVHLR